MMDVQALSMLITILKTHRKSTVTGKQPQFRKRNGQEWSFKSLSQSRKSQPFQELKKKKNILTL